MTRAETTKFLGQLLIGQYFSKFGNHWASEVSVDPWSANGKRVDFMQFSPGDQMSISGIEKGIFTCYEVKSCKEDVYSGNGLNFLGEKNYIVTTMECYKDILPDLRGSKFHKHLQECFPESSNYFGINAYEVNDHVWTERYIKKQPIHYLILRDSQYAEAMVSTFVEAVENTNGIIRNNMGDGKMAFVSRDDCALAAACAAMSDWEDRIVDINGAELLTIAQYMAIASEVTGKKTEYQYINDDEMYEFFDSIGVPRTTEEMWADTAKNFPFCSDGMVSFGRAIRLNQMSTFTDDFEKLTGQKPITVREMFEDMENHLIGTRTSTDN